MSMPNMSSQMGNIMKMQEMIQEDLGSKTVEGTSGGDLVKVEMNGRQELISIKIILTTRILYHGFEKYKNYAYITETTNGLLKSVEVIARS